MLERKYESKELYEALGKFITTYAEIEHWLSCILGILTGAEDNIWLEPFFIDNLMSGTITTKIHQAANVRLEDNGDLHKKLKDTLKKVSKLTTDRNILIHGQWIFDSTNTGIHDFRLRKITTEGYGYRWQRRDDKPETTNQKKGGKEKDPPKNCKPYWIHLNDIKISTDDLKGLTALAEQLYDELQQLRDEIKKYLGG